MARNETFDHNEGRILGALRDSNGMMRPDELRSRYDFSEPLHRGGNAELMKPASAILNIDLGITSLESRGYVELRQDGNAVKTLRLTAKGQRLIEESKEAAE